MRLAEDEPLRNQTKDFMVTFFVRNSGHGQHLRASDDEIRVEKRKIGNPSVHRASDKLFSLWQALSCTSRGMVYSMLSRLELGIRFVTNTCILCKTKNHRKEQNKNVEERFKHTHTQTHPPPPHTHTQPPPPHPTDTHKHTHTLSFSRV